MFSLLMRVRLLSGLNVARDTLRRHPLFAVGLILLGSGLFFGMTIGFWLFFQFAQNLHVFQETTYQIFYFLFLFLLAGAVPFVASTLLHSADYALLFVSPAPPRAVIAAKLLDATVTNSLQFTVLGIPAIVACAVVAGLPLPGWLLVPLLIALFVLLPALITALALLIALAALGMRRLRAAIAILNAVMAITVCITIVLEAGHLPVKPGNLSASITSLPSTLPLASPTAHASPSGWFAAALLALAQGQMSVLALELAKIALVVGGMYAACMLLGGRLLSAASVAEENDSGGNAGLVTHPDEGRFWRRLFSPPVAALIYKDFKYLHRDSVLLSQLAMPLILFCVPFLLALQDSSLQLREEMFPFATAMVGVIMFMQTSILSLSSIGLESQGFWMVLISPNTGRALLWAKFIMSTVVSAGIGVTLTLLSGLVFGMPPFVILIQLTFVLLCSAGLCGLGVGISAALPRFIYENPAHRVSAWALILGFFSTIGYLMTSAVIFGLAWFLTMNLEYSPQTLLIWGVSLVLYLILTAYAIFFPIAVGARRIERYQWEH